MELLNQDVINLVLLMLGAGALAGLAAGLFGIGGGLVVVPALMMFFPMLGLDEAHVFRSSIGTSLATIIFTSLRSAQAHAKKKAIDYSIIKNWTVFLIIGSILGAVFAASLKVKVLMILFASFIFILSFKFMFPEALQKIKLGTTMPKGFTHGFLGVFLGACSALFGIGGGSISIMIMTLYGVSIHTAIGTASGLAVPIALAASIGFIITGLEHQSELAYASLGYVNLIGLVFIVLASFFTAPLGAALAHKLNPMTMKKIFGVYLLFTSLNILRKALLI
ncbi:MAG: sulfite exporter TauE/SafE family protein [Candidatus Caenarcaniphilales bacterium]|nr:sulfite exporter TauE/SafE family protein [Candidatus Caenarcaniphilales bacterium]